MSRENIKNRKGVDLTSLAVNVVDMFDQANTGEAIEQLGSRGSILKNAVAELRFKLNTDGQKTILTGDQVGEHITELLPRTRHFVEK